MADWLSLLLRTSRAVFDPFFLKLLLLSALMCAAGFAAFAGLAWLGISWLDLADSWWAGWLFRWVGPGVAVFAGYFLFPVVFPLVTLLFLEPVAAHIERRHYPEATPGTAPSLKAELPNTLRFVALSLLINLMALPWYLIPGVYYIVNGYLFGREYFELIALRHMPARDMREKRLDHRGTVWMAGLLIAVMFTVPFVNLVAPILATVFMVHLWHRRVRSC
ncbi:MAG: EI24 domain-containing protein [Hyphomicrobiales bacterium]|nr:EI24 domain-containing protein [Hyphomicrobiales bacterium]